jgi:hypothetical protein
MEQNTFIDLANIGTFMSSVVAVLGLFLLYKTYITQKKELHATQGALMLQQKEMKQQNVTISKQLFDNDFNQNLRLLFDKFEAVQCPHVSGGEKIVGRQAFDYFYEKHLLNGAVSEKKQELVAAQLRNSNLPETPHNLEEIRRGLFYAITTFNGDYAFYQCDFKFYLDNCFRSLYRLIRSIYDSNTVAEKEKYIRIVVDQLTDYELILLFYNVLFSFRRDEFRPIIEDYNLFSHLNRSLLFDKEHSKEYADSAYKR